VRGDVDVFVRGGLESLGIAEEIGNCLCDGRKICDGEWNGAIVPFIELMSFKVNGEKSTFEALI